MNRVKNIKGSATSVSGAEWSRNGSLVNKPVRGWLHPDDRILQGGVCYGVRYIGCIEIRQSMRTLPFDLRAAVSKEAICRVVDEAGLRVPKKRKIKKDISRVLGEKINLGFAGSNINLTISVRSLQLIVMETGKVIANHLMQSISFASGGDGEVADFVGYVAKDPINSRACHVLECQGGLAPDVITTIGQAFELRFKEHLKNPPKPVTVPDQLNENTFEDGESAWGDDPVYYNELPPSTPETQILTNVTEQPTPASVNLIDFDSDVNHSRPTNDNITDEFYTEAEEPPDNPTPNHHTALPLPPATPVLTPSTPQSTPSPVSPPLPLVVASHTPETSAAAAAGPAPNKGFRHTYENAPLLPAHQNNNVAAPPIDPVPDHVTPVKPPPPTAHSVTNPFSMENLQVSISPQAEMEEELQRQPWFHGLMTRKQSEEQLTSDGDFLVRESTTTKGQYVLSGMQNSNPKHLMLVDPQGKVRTKDKVFDSVSHLIHYHRDNDLPIISSGSIVRLINPVPTKSTH